MANRCVQTGETLCENGPPSFCGPRLAAPNSTVSTESCKERAEPDLQEGTAKAKAPSQAAHRSAQILLPSIQNNVVKDFNKVFSPCGGPQGFECGRCCKDDASHTAAFQGGHSRLVSPVQDQTNHLCARPRGGATSVIRNQSPWRGSGS